MICGLLGAERSKSLLQLKYVHCSAEGRLFYEAFE